MHEVHAVKNIIAIIKEKAEEHNASKVKKVNIALGQFTGITKEDFTYWYNELSKGTSAAGAELSFKEIPERNVFLESIALEQNG